LGEGRGGGRHPKHQGLPSVHHDVFLFWWQPDWVVCTFPQVKAEVSKTRS
jgi:hypothetical protein